MKMCFGRHKSNFGFHRWSYSVDLKVRCCVLCGKSESTPSELFFSYRKKTKKFMGLAVE
jgi:hypothetical protein